MKKVFERFLKNESGAAAMEYSVIGTSIAVVLVVSLTTIGSRIAGWFGVAGAAMH